MTPKVTVISEDTVDDLKKQVTFKVALTKSITLNVMVIFKAGLTFQWHLKLKATLEVAVTHFVSQKFTVQMDVSFAWRLKVK